MILGLRFKPHDDSNEFYDRIARQSDYEKDYLQWWSKIENSNSLNPHPPYPHPWPGEAKP
jgi:hypothetical protein